MQRDDKRREPEGWTWVLMHGAVRHSASGCWSPRHGREGFGWRCFSTFLQQTGDSTSHSCERCCRGGAGCSLSQGAGDHWHTEAVWSGRSSISWVPLQNRCQWQTLVLICIVNLIPIFILILIFTITLNISNSINNDPHNDIYLFVHLFVNSFFKWLLCCVAAASDLDFVKEFFISAVFACSLRKQKDNCSVRADVLSCDQSGQSGRVFVPPVRPRKAWVTVREETWTFSSTVFEKGHFFQNPLVPSAVLGGRSLLLWVGGAFVLVCTQRRNMWRLFLVADEVSRWWLRSFTKFWSLVFLTSCWREDVQSVSAT